MPDDRDSLLSRPRLLLVLIAAAAGGIYAWWSGRPAAPRRPRAPPSHIVGPVAVENDAHSPSASPNESMVPRMTRSISITLASRSAAPLKRPSLLRSEDGRVSETVEPAGADATFDLTGDRPACWLLARAEGHLSRIVRPDDPMWNRPTGVVELEPRIELRVRLEDPTHAPIAGGRVRLSSMMPTGETVEDVPEIWRENVHAQFVTDGDGMTTLAAPAGRDSIDIDADAFGYYSRRAFSLSPKLDGAPAVVELSALAVAAVEIDTGLDGVPPFAFAPLSGRFGGDAGLKPASLEPDDRHHYERTLSEKLGGRRVNWMFAIERPTANGPVVYPQHRPLSWNPLPGGPALEGELVFRRIADFDPRDLTRLDASKVLAGRVATLEVEFSWVNRAEDLPPRNWSLRSASDPRFTVRPWSSPDFPDGRRTYTLTVAAGSWHFDPGESFVDPAPFGPCDVELAAGETRRLVIDRLPIESTGSLTVELDADDVDLSRPGWQLMLRPEKGKSGISLPLDRDRRFKISTGAYTATFWRGEVASEATRCEIRSGETTTLKFRGGQ